ncbi:YeiH family protein [Candidatus Pelagibacter sp. HIMB109]|uniref:YeiH family protein n=1 Tax=Candidatus Pelagibacter sp. HIMB109 TaxID=3415412 RepID=UPI003F831D3E
MKKNFLIATFVVAIAEYISALLSDYSIVISSAIVCILAGLLINHFQISNFENINNILTKNFLKIGVALIGIKISFFEFYNYASISFFIIVLNFVLIFILIKVLNSFLDSNKGMINLLGIGSAVCGITAIMAASSVMNNKKNDITCAVAVITLIGTLSVFVSPFFANLIFEQEQIKAGILLGATIHDTSQVTAAGTIFQNIYGDAQSFNSTISTKLLRNSFLIILIPLLTFYYSSQEQKNKLKFFNLIPPFIIFFMLLAVFRSIVDATIEVSMLSNWEKIVSFVSTVSKYLILFALFGLGSSISINDLKGFGFKPFLVGFCISVVLIVSTTIYLKLI